MKIIEEEGEEWACYSSEGNSKKYRLALSASITHVAYDGDRLCLFMIMHFIFTHVTSWSAHVTGEEQLVNN